MYTNEQNLPKNDCMDQLYSKDKRMQQKKLKGCQKHPLRSQTLY